MLAALLVREGPAYRQELFASGLRALGYSVSMSWPTSPAVVVVWNRYGRFHEYCRKYESEGATILVVENGYFGKDMFSEPYFAISRTAHAGAGTWPRRLGPARWPALGLTPLPLQRPPAGRVLRGLVLGQRSIGQRGVASPTDWARHAADELRGWGALVSIREHPGDLAKQRAAPDLQALVRDFDFVATWNSGAALKAMLWGKPVLAAAPHWVAAAGALPFAEKSLQILPHMTDNRLKAFEDAASAQWSGREVAAGDAFRALLEGL